MPQSISSHAIPASALILDVRSMMSYEETHLAGSYSLSMPSILWRRFLKQVWRTGLLEEYMMGDAPALIVRFQSPMVVLYDEDCWDVAHLPVDNPLSYLSRYFLFEGCNVRILAGGIRAALAQGCASISKTKSIILDAFCEDVMAGPSHSHVDGTHLNFIHGFLAIGSQAQAHDVNLLKRERVTHVLNLTNLKLHDYVLSTLQWKNVELRDSLNENLLVHLQPLLEFIHTVRNQSHCRILVHCFAGISRSVAVTIAYLMWADHNSLATAMQIVQAHRACASPNLNFIGQLLLLGDALSSLDSLSIESPCCTSVLTAACRSATKRLGQYAMQTIAISKELQCSTTAFFPATSPVLAC